MKPYLHILEGAARGDELGLLHVGYPMPDGKRLPIDEQIPIALNALGAVAIELRDLIGKCTGDPVHVAALRGMLPTLESIHVALMRVGKACEILNPERGEVRS
jgi:hypothetical protein